MDPELFVRCVERLHPLQLCHITFVSGSNGIDGLRRLVALTKLNPAVRIEGTYILTVLGIIQTGQWENVGRTIPVYGLMYADADLLSPIARDIERISVRDHYAKALFTSSPANKLAAATTIIGSVLNQSILDEVESWGARIDSRLTEIDGIPAVVFTLSNNDDGTELVEVALDGWSGRTAIDGSWGDTPLYIDPEKIRQLIYSALTDCLDRVTAAK